ncbi:MAG: polysaccharide deacetylase family protein [Bacteroidetes bacterium]|nr:polysaccharide deacetylase family protein [Bacteroidota bacterium]
MQLGLVFYYLIAFFVNIITFSNTSSIGKHLVIPHSVQQVRPLIDSNIKTIYLSFDDGPLTGTTNCIDICTREKVPATFFEVGLHQSRSAFGKNVYQQILKDSALFAFANHSFSHAYSKYISFYHHPDSALLDFLKGKYYLKPTNNITRLPGNNAWNLMTKKRASELVSPLVKKMDSIGFNIIGWDLQWRFNKNGRPIQSPKWMAMQVDSLFFYNQTVTKNHLVILMHDQMYRAPQDSIKLEKFIQLLKQNGHYTFQKLTHYPGLKPNI